MWPTVHVGGSLTLYTICFNDLGNQFGCAAFETQQAQTEVATGDQPARCHIRAQAHVAWRLIDAIGDD
jgi:hypothetical protein